MIDVPDCLSFMNWSSDRRTGIQRSWMRHLGICSERPNEQLLTMSKAHLTSKVWQHRQLLRIPSWCWRRGLAFNAFMYYPRTFLLSHSDHVWLVLLFIQPPFRLMRLLYHYLILAMCSDDQVTQVYQVIAGTENNHGFHLRMPERRLQLTESVAGIAHGVR